ncbi:MAG: response regulator [Flavobacteriales bacterium]
MWDEYAIVEDNRFDQLIAERLVKTFDSSGEVHVFDNGRPALDYFLSKQDHSKKALILLDINMPVMDGHEFIKGLRESEQSEEILNNVRIVIMTSSIRTGDRTDTVKFPFVLEYIEKPITKEKIQSFWNVG